MNKTKWTFWLFLVAIFSLSAVKAIAGEGEISSYDFNTSAIHCDQLSEPGVYAENPAYEGGSTSASIAAQ